MVNKKMKLGFCALTHILLCVVSSFAKEEPLFRVRRRVLDTDVRELYSDDLFLTYSEEGRSKTLDDFILVMFQTPSQIQGDAIPVLRMALNKFLLAELDAIYSPDGFPLESVASEVLSYSSTTKAAGRRSLQEIGTQAEMEVIVKFKSEPSPQRVLLEDSIRDVMSNLQYFVTNLTSFQHSDWKDVTEAYRLEMGTDAPTASPAGGTDSIQQPDDNANDGGDGEKNNVVGAVVPTTLVGATFLAILAFLFVQRRSRNTPENTSTKAGSTRFVGVDNDLYSMDKSLESSQSPLGLISPMAGSNDYSSVDGSVPEDSVFSGIDYTPSTHTNVKGTKSMLSGITNTSASTIRASNMEQKQRQRMQALAATGSLFAFEEEGGHDDDLLRYDSGDDNLKTDSNDVDVSEHGAAPSMEPHEPYSPPNQPIVRAGTTDQAKPAFLASYGHHQPIEPGSSSHVLMDLEKLANSRAPSPRPDPIPTSVQQASGAISYNIFNCNPILPKETQTLYTTKYALDGSENNPEAANTGHVATPMNRAFLTCGPQMGASTTKTPLVRNTDFSTTTRRSASSSQSPNSRTLKGQRSNSQGAIENMSVKGTRVVGGVYNADGKLIRDRLAMSVDDTALLRGQQFNPPTSGSKSVPSSPERNRIRGDAYARIRAMQMHDFDYIDNLSRPSTPGADPDSPRLGDYDNLGYRSYGFNRHSNQAPSAPGEDPPGNGRRHVGNTGIDGTAMYQTNAMHPLDWSYKSADMQSVGDSVLSENDGAAMPTQFLFGGSKRGERTVGSRSPERGTKSPKTPKTPISQKSGKSEQTHDSSKESTSRQLINDLVWLERKIADVRQGSTQGPPGVTTVDSLSYVSDDNVENLSASSRDESEGDPTVSTGKNGSVMSSIVCRDCYAPPGKLHIVIHSTKDGPAVHTVKQGSSLEGHIFPGDLIISVDNVDTRSFTAEQVMKMMAAKSNKERKITVLHFEEED